MELVTVNAQPPSHSWVAAVSRRGPVNFEFHRLFAQLRAGEDEAAMIAGGVPCARYRTVGEVMASPYAAERGVFATVRDSAGEFMTTRLPYKMSGAGVVGPAPELGADNRKVAGELPGCSREDIEAFEREGLLCGLR